MDNSSALSLHMLLKMAAKSPLLQFTKQHTNSYKQSCFFSTALSINNCEKRMALAYSLCTTLVPMAKILARSHTVETIDTIGSNNRGLSGKNRSIHNIHSKISCIGDTLLGHQQKFLNVFIMQTLALRMEIKPVEVDCIHRRVVVTMRMKIRFQENENEISRE